MLKNLKIGVLIEDRRLRWALSRLLMERGAIVHSADTQDELATLAEHLDLELAIVSVPKPKSLIEVIT